MSNLNISSIPVKSLIRPLLWYTCSAWDPWNNGEIDELKMIQRSDHMFVTNRLQNTSGVGGMLQYMNCWSL